MFKTIALVVIFGCALAAPTPRVDDPHRAQAINFIPGNDIKELESSLDEMAALFKQSFQKYADSTYASRSQQSDDAAVLHNQPTPTAFSVVPLIRYNSFDVSPGANKKFDFVTEDDSEARFLHDIQLNPTAGPARQDSREEYRGAQARDPLVGTEEAAARAIDSPLFFNTFDHAHMVTGYAERRRDQPMLLRSIRPDFPFSDISRRRQRV